MTISKLGIAGILICALIATASAMDGWADYGNVVVGSSNGNQGATASVEFTNGVFSNLGAEATGDSYDATVTDSGTVDTYGGYVDATATATDYAAYDGDTATTMAEVDDYYGYGSELTVNQNAGASYDDAAASQSVDAYGDYAYAGTSSSSDASFASTTAEVYEGYLEGGQGADSAGYDSGAGQSMEADGYYPYLATYAWEFDGNSAETGIESYDWADIYADQSAYSSYFGWDANAGQYATGYGYDVDSWAYADDPYYSDSYSDVYTYNDYGYTEVENYADADTLNEVTYADEYAYLDGYYWFGAGSDAYSYSSSDYAYADYYNGQVTFWNTGATADWTGYADAWVF